MPRYRFDEADRQTLVDLSRMVVDEMELRRRAADRIDTLSQLAGSAERTKQQFLAMINHELRTPLNAIMGNAELLQSGLFGSLGERNTAAAADIVTAGGHLASLIERILTVSRIENGELGLVLSVEKLGSLIERALNVLRASAERKGIGVEVVVDESLPHFHVDAEQMIQILIQLIDNAIKFSDEATTVVIEASRCEDGSACIEICDRGAGMDPVELDAALAWFDQADARLERIHEGTGLGVPLAKRLVELHGGSLNMESRKGDGTKARLMLPQTLGDGARVAKQAR